MGRVGRKKRMKAWRKACGISGREAKLRVFDNIHRTDFSPKRNVETNYGFYNRSARSAFDNVRNVIEEAVKYYPDSEAGELISRIKSGNDIHFRSAVFELFLHEAMRRQGFSLVPHPKLPNGSACKPDFLVSDSNGISFYLEAVLAKENNEQDKGGEARKGVVLDTLSNSPHENFVIAIDDKGSPDSPPSGKKLNRLIHKWLDALDPDEVSQQIEKSGLDSGPFINWSHDGWNLKIRPIPLKPERRGKSTNLVGIGGVGGGWVDGWSPIRNAIKFKGGKYGDLDKPLVIAVNMDSFHLNRIDEMQALYGQEQYIFTPSANADLKMQRASNGAWHGKSGPQYTRVSAAWLFNDLNASSLAVSKSTVYFNPWAEKPAPESLKCFPFALPKDSKMEWKDGASFSEIFQLNEGWPEVG